MNGFAELLLTFLPLFVVLLFANRAQKQREVEQPHEPFAWMAYLVLGGIYTLMFVAGLVLQFAGPILLQQPELLETVGLDGASILLESASLSLIGLGVWLLSLLGILLLTPPIRRMYARLLPLEADNPVHAVALSMSVFIFVNMLVILGVGLGNLAESLQSQIETGEPLINIHIVWAQQILTALLAMIGVGWLTRLNRHMTFARLKLALPSSAEVRIGILTGLFLVPTIMTLEAAASFLGFGPDADVGALTEQLLGSLFQSPLGILTLGIAAALGEETLFRGALQPRFGLVLTALLFALVHGNYGLTVSTLIVFVLGLVLGTLRNRHNTTTAMITHAVYNMTLGAIGFLAARFVEF